MDRGSLCGWFVLLLVASGDAALRMCARCECIDKDGVVEINCNNMHLTERHLRQIQGNPNATFVSLNFSNNTFTFVPVGLNTRGVKYLDLSLNNIKQLRNLNNFGDLVELNLAYNEIKDFGREPLEFPFLSLLNMSSCSLKELTGFQNCSMEELTSLDLSHNKIEFFDERYLGNMTKLNYLDLSWNFLKEIDVLSFVNLQILNVESNLIGPSLVFSNTLLELNVQNNSISEISMDEDSNATSSSLVFLYLNQNKFSMLPNVSFPSLKILDLSKNEFKAIPEVLNNDSCPILDILILSENEFENFAFQAPIKLMHLRVNGIKKLRKLKKDAFKMLANYPNECINISIKDNLELHTIEDNAFEDLDLCFLDLGNNNLGHLPKIQLQNGDWRNITHGVNFQNNPIDCDCESQWLLDEFVPFYYGSKLELLLSDLKCAEPHYLRHYRLVHWYGWKNSIFCQAETNVVEAMTSDLPERSFGEILLQANGTMLIILASCIAVLATLFIVGLVLVRKAAMRKTRRNRRY